MNTRLIHTLLIVFTIFWVSFANAQQATISPKLEKKFEKTYEKAIKKGKDTYGAYHSKSVKEENEYCEYLRKKGFIILGTGSDFTFIEDKLIEDYVCRKHTSHPYEDFKKDCYFHYFSEWSMEPECWGSSFIRALGEFKGFKISWLGDVINGNIEGKGIGFYRNNYEFYIIKDSEFHHSFPTTNGIITQIKYERYSNKYNFITEKKYSLKLGCIPMNNTGISIIQGRGLCSSDALTRKASIAFYGEYCATLPENERFALDDNAYYNIKSTYDVDYYVGAFPNGRHIHEVAQWVPNDFEGFRIFELETLDNVIKLIQTYVKAEMHGGSDLIDASIKKPSPYTMDRINNENEKLLKRASFFAEDIKNNLANDKYALEKVQSFYDYLDILNGFYAVQKSSDISSCIDEDFWGQIASSNPNTTYTLSRLGRLVKSSYEESGKAILKRIDEKHFEEYDFLIETYDYIFNHYSSFIKSVNGRLQMENNSHVRQKLSSSTLRDYKIEDGELVITLQNNDIYRFRQSDGKWKYSSGNTIIVLASSIAYNSIEEAIRGAEKMNREYWEQGK